MNHDDKFDGILEEMQSNLEKRTDAQLRRILLEERVIEFIEDFGNLIGGIVVIILFIAAIFWILYSSHIESQKEVQMWKEFLAKNECVLVENGRMNGRWQQSSYLCNNGSIYWVNQWIVTEMSK